MKFNRNYITPFVALIFLVIAISGLLMYLHLFDGYTEVVHENLAVAFVIFAILHIIVNWAGLRTHFRKSVIIPAAITTFLIAAGFVYLQINDPKLDTILLGRIIKAPIPDAFRALNVDYERAAKNFAKKGIVLKNSKTIEDIWEKNDISPVEVVDLIVE
jgi:hypothetical protein